jgi:hypothetical protein
LLAAFACARVDVFASAFPFFNNIDEYRHADRVLKYARGYRPEAQIPKVEPEFAEWMARFGSPEYTKPREAFPSGVAPPPTAPEEMEPVLRALYEYKLERFREFPNVDAQQPPLYPLVASGVYRIAVALGLTDVRALYFVRWMNGPVLAALVVASWLFLRRSHSGDTRIRLGVPLWISAYPHDLFFGITDDVPMALLGGLAFLLTLAATFRTPTRPGLVLLGGGVLALALLDKTTALFFAPVFALLATDGTWRAARAGVLGRELRAWAGFALALGLPAGLWIVHNLALYGDATAIAAKYEALGIARVPWRDWIHRPLADPANWLSFAASMTRTFWRGEVSWYKRPIRSPAVDVVYVASSAVALALAVVGIARARVSPARRTEAASLVAVAVAFGALAVVSITYRYIGAYGASRAWMASSRFVVWAVVPFAIAWVRGVEVASRAAPARWRGAAFWIALGSLLLVSMIGEVVLTLPVFASSWNWYHLR